MEKQRCYHNIFRITSSVDFISKACMGVSSSAPRTISTAHKYMEKYGTNDYQELWCYSHAMWLRRHSFYSFQFCYCFPSTCKVHQQIIAIILHFYSLNGFLRALCLWGTARKRRHHLIIYLEIHEWRQRWQYYKNGIERQKCKCKKIEVYRHNVKKPLLCSFWDLVNAYDSKRYI